ncbi:MAG TPA: molecular chaperone DnaJ [Marmoricola sp.]|nr:molecular chaperone DnaJ [Marmoricola sp.]
MNNADWADKDFYKILGVAKDADASAIKKAWRKIAKENHPDTHPGDTARHDTYKAASEANDVIGDPAKRKEYDEYRAAVSSGGFGGFTGNFGGGGAQGFDVSDLFGGLFNGGGFSGARPRAPRPSKGADVEAQTTLSFVDAVNGTTISLSMASDQPCPTCHGTGGRPGSKPVVCPVCDGAGSVMRSMGGFSVNETCPRCHGQQLVYAEACPTCHGSGRGTSDRKVQARIPAGVDDGQRIRLKGKGAAGENGGPAGDLYIKVRVLAHPIFTRSGTSLKVDVPVAFDEAVLGAEVKVPTLGGSPVTLRVPPGTPNGRTLRVRGRGVPRSDGTKGDLLATVVVQVPESLNDEAKAAIEAYREARGTTDPRAALLGGA